MTPFADDIQHSDLQPSIAALQATRDLLARRLRRGLAREGEEIRALPAYLGPPRRGLRGRAMVLDTGGTHVRAAVVELGPGNRWRVLARTPVVDLPLGRGSEPMKADEFFDFHARLLASLHPQPDLPLGFCFSYPSRSQPSGDAILLRWTKGVHVEGLEGRPVGRELGLALDRLRLRVSGIRVLNDTVAALMAGARHHFPARPGSMIGLVLATGTNMAAFVPPRLAPKLPWASLGWDGVMAFNMESGNFHPPCLAALDDALDSATDNPGEQRLEKAVSGAYLPRLFALATGRRDIRRAQDLVRLRDSGATGSGLAAALLRRSATLVAAALAGMARGLGLRDDIHVAAEGGLFWGAPAYASTVLATIGPLSPTPVHLHKLEDANLLGSACAALEHPAMA